MSSRLIERKRWLLLAVIVLTVVCAGEIAVRAQFGGAPGGAPAAAQPAQLPQQPAAGAGHMDAMTVYTCLNCGREIGRGPAAPAPPCPFCGFAGDPGRIVVHMRADGRGRWLSRLRPTFLYTVGIEGSLLAGLVLVGVLRLALDRVRRSGATEGEA